jgi:hypothetical protein
MIQHPFASAEDAVDELVQWLYQDNDLLGGHYQVDEKVDGNVLTLTITFHGADS